MGASTDIGVDIFPQEKKIVIILYYDVSKRHQLEVFSTINNSRSKASP
jgi:hypothetical protein